jgi:hypothetical protein
MSNVLRPVETSYNMRSVVYHHWQIKHATTCTLFCVGCVLTGYHCSTTVQSHLSVASKYCYALGLLQAALVGMSDGLLLLLFLFHML